MAGFQVVRKASLAALLLAGGVLVTGARSSAAEPGERAERGSRAGTLEGTWRAQVALVNCSTGQQLGAPFASLLTFGQGGTATETTANAAFFPAMRGPGHGVWNAEGERRYSAAIIAFITKDGALVRSQTITQEISLGEDGDSFSSVASVEFSDPAGTVLARGCATATGLRFR